jgi:hypothetical protein
MDNCTFCANGADTAGGGITIFNGLLRIENSIISHSTAGEAIYCGALDDVMMSCSDVYGNAGGDYTGCLNGLLGVDHNISLDPEYCDRVNGDLRLEDGSPCDHPVCGVMGAGSIGCSK